jgi:hypothetical protein
MRVPASTGSVTQLNELSFAIDDAKIPHLYEFKLVFSNCNCRHFSGTSPATLQVWMTAVLNL